MSNTKTIMGQASNQYVTPTDITDLFSTYLYKGNGDPNTSNTQTITNGIDLDGKGGLVWIKKRTQATAPGAAGHYLFDTERGSGDPWKYIRTDSTVAQDSDSNTVTSFNSNGFSIGYKWWINGNDEDIVSWTWRKAPKFFDCVTYTGTGDTTTQTISHNLGAVPGCIIVKRTDSADSWRVYHRGVDVNSDGQPWTDMLTLNTTAAASDYPVWGDTAPTSTQFTVGYESSVNGSGGTYVAYIFAHNDSGDGGFGPTYDQDIIKCGSYTGNDGTQDINLGFEPQWILVKSSSNARDWKIIDNMRGFAAAPNNKWLTPNSSNSEENINSSASTIEPTATGFRLTTGAAETNAAGWDYIFMAIRRGPLAPPEAGTEVFMPLTYTSTGSAGNKQTTGFPVDLAMIAGRTDTASWKHAVIPRLTGGLKYLSTSSTAAETGTSSGLNLDDMTGYTFDGAPFNNSGSMYSLNLKRAPSFFDVVAYTGDSTSSRTISHNLGVTPEMIWIKKRDATQKWIVGSTVYSGGGHQSLNEAGAVEGVGATGRIYYAGWNSSTFGVGNDSDTNAGTGAKFIAYLFASLAGVSKVGSFTATGSVLNIDCGFTSGARFVLIKSTDFSEGWFVFDSVRGITTSTSPYLFLNSTSSENTANYIDPLASGFRVTTSFYGSGDFIFYAIA